jgi:DNA repair protein RadA/Sms
VKAKTPGYICQACGAVQSKWSGRCDECGAWNSLAEEARIAPAGASARRSGKGRPVVLEALHSTAQEPPRRLTGVAEFDRVTGGGIVPGSALLLGGDPGVGKSTLLLQVAAAFAMGGGSAVYISGEEALPQLRLRASRMGLSDAPVQLGAATCVEDILATLSAGGSAPDIVVVDSIQTIWSSMIDAAPGTITQVRTATHDLVRYAKTCNTAVILVGHVTKDGQIAGPKAVEHLVDAVLYFEGERAHQFRILRSVKNRFGATDEIGVFEMTGVGLAEVANPSALFLGDRSAMAAGAAVFAGMEGTRPLLCEVQALTAASGYGTARRAVVGWDQGRLAMVLAVLEARGGVSISGQDVYLNVAGGLRIAEPAADLASASALVSAFTGRPLPKDCVIFGEIALSGDIRPAPFADARLREAAKLGFTKALLPAGMKISAGPLQIRQVRNVAELASILATD